MRKIEKILIHCSDTWDEENLSKHWYKRSFHQLTETERSRVLQAVHVGIAQINGWHAAEGFSASPSTGLHVGYHAIIRRDGVVEVARDESEAGIHCKGHNATSLAVCLVGGKRADTFTKAQYEALMPLVLGWLARYGLEPKQVFGHREMNPGKLCPNISNLDALRDNLEVQYYKLSKGDK